MTTFDAVVIGAGQAGPPLAERLTAAGMTVAFVERHLSLPITPSGSCVLKEYVAYDSRTRTHPRWKASTRPMLSSLAG
jgi:pyruvate/2-oxoglutarate dehydrogenase complex dihydrolipoamide dehydrogenase (E3) component